MDTTYNMSISSEIDLSRWLIGATQVMLPRRKRVARALTRPIKGPQSRGLAAVRPITDEGNFRFDVPS